MALISKTGAALEALTVDGVDLIDPNAAHNQGQIFFGSILAPWPNRLDGGRYQLGDKEGAAESLAEGNQMVDQFFSDWNGEKVAPHLVDHWICCAMLRLAQAEANSVL